LSAYALPGPYARPPLRQRLSSIALALAINLGLLLILMTLGIIPPPSERSLRGITVELLPEQKSAAPTHSQQTQAERRHVAQTRPVPKPPPIILPVKATIAPPPRPTKDIKPWVEMSKQDMAASDISKLAAAGSGSAGDSEVVGHGPNGEAMYAAEWARRPTNAEIDGYLAKNAPEGFGLVACKTIPGDRVEDCVELDQTPGSHLASAVRQAAWQFRVRPPRKGGKALIGSWVRIEIDYYNSGSGSDRG
jgi:protein TonB